MEQTIVNTIRANIARLIKLREFSSLTKLAQAAGLDPKTVTGLMAKDALPNPTAKNLYKIAKALKVETWMLMIEDFPFDQVKGKALKTMSGPTYVIANAMEHEEDGVKLLMMESASQTLRGIDDRRSLSIKKAQASYLSDSKD